MPERPESMAPATWDEFLEAYADELFRLARLFTQDYDDRMDLFLFVCERLKRDGMKRLKSFRFRPEAPCRFSTFLSVVVKNIAIDFIRSRQGRFRPFRAVAARDSTDQLLFGYHVRDGRSLEETRQILSGRHGVSLTSGEVTQRAARLQASLSASQRWRLLARMAESRLPLSIDAVEGMAFTAPGERSGVRCAALNDDGSDPETPLRRLEADRLLSEAMSGLPARCRLALVLRYRDDLSPRLAAEAMGISSREWERLVREGLDQVRRRLEQGRITRGDLEPAGLGFLWAAGESRT